MADIDQIIAGGGKVDSKLWDNLGGIFESYQKGRDYRYQQDQRNAFKGDDGGFRQDLLDENGNPDAGKMYKRLMLVGGAPGVDAAAKAAETGFQLDRYRNAPAIQAMLDGTDNRPTANLPPSTSRNAPERVLPPLARGGLPQPSAAAPPGSPQGDRPGSIMGMVTDAGVPPEHIGVISDNLARTLRIDPNAPVPPKDAPRVQQALQAFIARNGGATPPQPPAGAPPQEGSPFGGQVPIPQPRPMSAPQAQPVAQAQQQPPQPQQAQPAPHPTDPTLGGLIPPGYPDPGAYVQRLEAVAASGRVLPDQMKILHAKIEAIRKALEPTNEMKNARAAGMGIVDYKNLDDRNKEQLQILEKSILPKLDKSQEVATAARDEILAMHRAREQLDAPGGIFSGSVADVRLKVAKVAEFLGVPNADKIANTEAFGSAIGSRVLSLVKGLGAGTSISNADREFAAGMAGGNIKLDEKSIRRILDIGERAARSRIDLHNSLTDRTLKATDALKGYPDVYRVDAPGQYQKVMPGPRVGDVVDGHRFLGGNPKDQRSWARP